MPDRTPLTALRYLGLLGSALLAGGAYLAGALPGRADTDGLPGPDVLPGVLLCLAGLVVLTVAWWQIGRAGPDAASPGGRWTVVTAALWALPLLIAPPLASRDVYAYACQGAIVSSGHNPYAIGPAALPCGWLDSVPAIWRDSPSPYGPLFSLLSAGAADVSGGRIAVAVGLLRAVALAGAALAIWYGRRLALASGVPPGRAAWLGLASPLVLVHAVSGAHSDALFTGLILAGMGYAVARRGEAAGVALGLACAVKITALAVAPFALIPLAMAVRRGRAGTHRHRNGSPATGDGGAPAAPDARRPVAGLGIAAARLGLPLVASYAVLALLSGLGVGSLAALRRTGDLAQWTSLPTGWGMAVGYLLRALGLPAGFSAAVTAARLVGLAILVGMFAGVWWWAWRQATTRAAVVGAGVVLAGVALLGPVFYPWYALTPLALLAVATTTDQIRAWLGVAAAALSYLVLPDGAGLAPRTKLPGALLVTAVSIVVAVKIGQARVRADPARPIPRG